MFSSLLYLNSHLLKFLRSFKSLSHSSTSFLLSHHFPAFLDYFEWPSSQVHEIQFKVFDFVTALPSFCSVIIFPAFLDYLNGPSSDSEIKRSNSVFVHSSTSFCSVIIFSLLDLFEWPSTEIHEINSSLCPCSTLFLLSHHFPAFLDYLDGHLLIHGSDPIQVFVTALSSLLSHHFSAFLD
ncbi:unnamed protein product [Acanthosepion pharaonis]|uniref:Uncharacterized protein n=1 Tax=Acanthosepion pharaonis TaxID=158019 RepID=A0A812D9K1_ACAPH|nr:unnamed protein product [Sepia pharaonis]